MARRMRAAGFLVHGGGHPGGEPPILDASLAKRINALMLTCGTYDAAGDFAFRVGLPAKSGVGGRSEERRVGKEC